MCLNVRSKHFKVLSGLCCLFIHLIFSSYVYAHGIQSAATVYAEGTQCSTYLVHDTHGLEALDSLHPAANTNELLKSIRDVVTSANTLEGSYYNYALLADRWKNPEILPRFVSPSTEMELVKKWVGIEGPKTLQTFLPKGASYIGHQLREPAGPNVVKVQETGATVMLRVSEDEFGFDTNVAYSKYAAAAYVNETPENRYLVRKDARAAIIYLHGGGTPTTGAHIAEAEINHYGMYKIDVVSLDMAAHGEGSRKFFPNGQVEIDGIYQFIRRAVPEGVPVFVVGHSMGGVYADIMMRQSDRDDYPMRGIIQGFGILSPAVDALPGATPYEKAIEMGRLMDAQKNDPEYDLKAAPSEREIFDQMARDGKLNPIASFHIGMIMAEQDHVPPKHKGKDWTPAIMVVGQGDPLVYIGFEHLFDKAFELDNVESHIIETAPDRDGVKKRVGHLLADYYINDEVLPLKMVRDFINNRLLEINPEEGPLKSARNVEAKDSASIFQAYASDLVFREWVEHARIVLKENMEGFKDIAREIPQIENKIRSKYEGLFDTKTIRKQKFELARLSEADVLIQLKDKFGVHSEDYKGKPYEAIKELLIREEVPEAVVTEVAELTIAKRVLEAKRDGEWVPEELKGDASVQLLMSSIKSSQDQVEQLRRQKADLIHYMRSFEQRKITVEAQVKQTLKDMDSALEEVLLERAKGLAERFVIVKDKFYSATEKIEQEAGESITRHGELLASEKQRLFDKYSDELDSVYAILADYKNYRAETEKLYEEEVLKGRLGSEKQELFEEFYGRNYLATGNITEDSLLGRWNNVQLRIAQVEGQIYRRYLSIGILEQNYWSYVNPGLVRMEVLPVKELLDRAVDESGQIDNALIAKIWKQWKEIKK